MKKQISFPLLNKIQEIIGEPLVFSIGVNDTETEIIRIDVVAETPQGSSGEKTEIEAGEDNKISLEEAKAKIKSYETNMRKQIKDEVGYFG